MISSNKRGLGGGSTTEASSFSPRKKSRPAVGKNAVAVVDLKYLDVPLFSAASRDGSHCDSISLLRDHPYTIGRQTSACQFVFHDRKVSKQHCQILFDGSIGKLYILGGVLSVNGDNDSSDGIVHEFRNRLLSINRNREVVGERFRFRQSTNGVFVNGTRVRKGMATELLAGDKVLFVCGNENGCSNNRNRIGFIIERIDLLAVAVQDCDDVSMEKVQVLQEAITSPGHSQGLSSCGKRKKIFAFSADDVRQNSAMFVPKHVQLVEKTKYLASQRKGISHGDGALHCNKDSCVDDSWCGGAHACGASVDDNENDSAHMVDSEVQSKYVRLVYEPEKLQGEDSHIDGQIDLNNGGMVESDLTLINGSKVVALEAFNDQGGHLSEITNSRGTTEDAVTFKDHKILFSNTLAKVVPSFGSRNNKTDVTFVAPPPGKNFYLNRLEFFDCSLFHNYPVISLPELLYPVESITRMFIATFTSDIKWFLSYCKIPFSLPVTVACHNAERCRSSRPEKRISVPFSEYPNLIVVYPPFPDSITFGGGREKLGVACHHPKLLILQRAESMRVIITSANLVEKQWKNVTNTVWWQDFPWVDSPDYLSLFPPTHDSGIHEGSKSDFAAQLAGFMATLLVDISKQAHWITELAKYNFGGAMGHLITSVPGIHSCQNSFMLESVQSLPFLGSVEASVVGLSHLFRSAADSNGTKLKMVAALVRKSSRNAHEKLEITLRRNPNLPADANAVSIFVANPDQLSGEEYVQLGFLPRNVAKWVSPLWDAGLFMFSGYVCPKEALAAALGENCKKLQLILHVSQGDCFQDISKMNRHEHVVALCSLIASIRRCSGLWRLQEVLTRYKWPDSVQSDFMYSASSIGSSINPQFGAAFAAAAGKKSQHYDSEESDPEWGYWNATDELRNPSIQIIFPTIERVKSLHAGILPARYILCFSEKTWQKVRTIGILHDAIPHPSDRLGYPMHVKVACRRYKLRKDASSFGWVYFGSHNFSAAAWGQPIKNPHGTKVDARGNPLSSALRICNYELGIVFIFPPTDKTCTPAMNSSNLDDIILPFVVPAPKYGPRDRPATKQAMREALAELTEQEKEQFTEEIMEEVRDKR